jgi:hypothetical protein
MDRNKSYYVSCSDNSCSEGFVTYENTCDYGLKVHDLNSSDVKKVEEHLKSKIKEELNGVYYAAEVTSPWPAYVEPYIFSGAKSDQFETLEQARKQARFKALADLLPELIRTFIPLIVTLFLLFITFRSFHRRYLKDQATKLNPIPAQIAIWLLSYCLLVLSSELSFLFMLIIPPIILLEIAVLFWAVLYKKNNASPLNIQKPTFLFYCAVFGFVMGFIVASIILMFVAGWNLYRWPIGLFNTASLIGGAFGTIATLVLVKYRIKKSNREISFYICTPQNRIIKHAKVDDRKM